MVVVPSVVQRGRTALGEGAALGDWVATDESSSPSTASMMGVGQ